MGIEVILLADKLWSPAWKLINPKTWEPFVNSENNIIVWKTENWSPDWFDIRSLNLLAERLWDTSNPITTEWENIPWEVADHLERLWFTVFPNSKILTTIQDRLTEKESITSRWLNTVPYWKVDSLKDIHKFIWDNWWFDTQYILKTRRWWYDWHGQERIKSKENIELAYWRLMGINGWLIIEKMIKLKQEASVIVARDMHWNIWNLEPILNIHDKWILRRSITSAPISQELKNKLTTYARNLITNWQEYVWILTVEFFIDESWEIYVNELAPRPHNSWHATLDNWWTSQNDLWMNAISWRVLSVVNWTKTIVMDNLLTPGSLEFYRLLSYRNSTLKFYDYLKLEKNDWLWTDVRKVWHVNYIPWWNWDWVLYDALWNVIKYL